MSTAVCRHDGFSLLEVLVAIAILAIGLVSLAQILSITTAANATAGKVTYAALLASQAIEDVRAAPWEAAASTPGESVENLNRTGRPQPSAEKSQFTRRLSITPLISDPANALVIEATVTAAGSRAVARIVTVRARSAP